MQNVATILPVPGCPGWTRSARRVDNDDLLQVPETVLPDFVAELATSTPMWAARHRAPVLARLMTTQYPNGLGGGGGYPTPTPTPTPTGTPVGDHYAPPNGKESSAYSFGQGGK